MKIAVLSKADVFGGGASRIAVELTSGLSELGVDVQHFVGWGGRRRLRDRYTENLVPVFGRRRALRFAHKCGMVSQWMLGLPEALPLEWPALRRSGLLDADLIHVHDITELMSARSLLWLSHIRPVIWTLHDFSPLTAGCIYPFDKEPLGCRRWRVGAEGCGSDCPIRTQRLYPFGGLFNGVKTLWKRKALLAEHGRLTLTSPSTWLADEVAQSILYAGRRPQVIFNGIDVAGKYRNLPKSRARVESAIPGDRLVIALIAGDLTDRNKGFAWGVEALEKLPKVLRDRALALCIGKLPSNAPPPSLAGLPVSWTGYVEDSRRMAQLLSAADLLLYPALADNQPLAVIEAMSCGTPVFAFQTGGIPEIIGREGGVVVPRKDTSAMARAIAKAAEKDIFTALGETARRRAVEYFGRDRMVRDFISLYQQVLSA
jgi:glycosyltransferase involved in cell wall biosynthesis